MTNQITDNRAVVDLANSAPGAAPGWTDLGGTFGGITLDTEIKIEGSGSIGQYATTTRDGIFWTYAADTDLSNNHVYFWFNCGIVGLLDPKASQGLTFRMRGPTISNYREWDLAGSDAWPVAVEGGWVLFCIDLESAGSRDVGTAPATTAIRSLGVTFITTSVMPRMADNCWMDAMYSLADGVPGIIVEGRNGGATDWTFADIVTQLGAAVGTFRDGAGGSYVCNTPIQFGIDDVTTHGFTDTNKIILWDDQEWVASDLYKLSALGNSGGTTNVTLGVKTGSGDDATGAQGCVIQASSAGVRWDGDFDDPDLDGINFYGCTLIHGGDFQLDDPAVSFISTFFIDCTAARIDNCADFLRCTVIDANTADGVAFLTTDDLTDAAFCRFEFSDGHAVELTTTLVTPQASKGNVFVGYGATASNDAAIYNNAGGAVVINVASEGSTPTYRNGAGASTTVNNNKTVVFKGMKDNTEVRIYKTSDDSVVDGIENATAGSPDNREFSWSAAAGLDVYYVLHSLAYETIRKEGYIVPNASSTDVIIDQRFDRNFNDPA